MHRVRHAAFLAVILAAAPAAARQPAAEAVPAPRGGVAQPPGDVPADDMSYALGYRIGGRILEDNAELGVDIDRAALARGITDAITGAKPALDEARFARALAAFEAGFARRQEEFAKRMQEIAKVNLAKGREFLAANAKRPGVVTRASGLQYEVLKDGDGPAPGPQDVVEARYRGTHIDGTEFDASEPDGKPVAFPLRGVVPGWQEALPLMKAGAKWRLWIPPDLAYGPGGSPPVIGPNEVLVFEIELVRSGPASSDQRP